MYEHVRNTGTEDFKHVSCFKMLSCSLLCQYTLGRGNLACSAWINFTRFSERSCKGLEGGLHNMMRVLASKLTDVQRHATSVNH